MINLIYIIDASAAGKNLAAEAFLPNLTIFDQAYLKN